MRFSTVLIIGGAGFLGSALSDRFRSGGARVFVVGRRPRANSYSSGDYLTSDQLESFDRTDIDLVVDCAGSIWPATSLRCVPSPPVLPWLDLVERIGASGFLYISSGGTIYGEPTALPVAEDHPLQPISAYGASKCADEAAVLARADSVGFEAWLVRPSNVYGPGNDPDKGRGLAAAAFGAALSGRPLTLFGDGGQVRDYIFIDDFAEAAVAVINRAVPNLPYNIGSGRGMDANELLRRVADIVARDGFSLKVRRQPARAGDVARNVLDISRVQAATGWRPSTSLEKGLTTTWGWIKSDEFDK